LSAMGFNAIPFLLAIPVVAAAMLSVLPGYRLPAVLNIGAAFLTLAAALSLLIEKPAPDSYILVDDLNIVFVILTTFVGFTTSVFSASYIAHELETGRLTPAHLRFYHAMYQMLLFSMNLALIANNIGLMWVAIEIATLTTVIMVGIYQTEEAIEAAWKYFILGSVGIALALFGTILVYMAARPVVGEGRDGMVWTILIERVSLFDPALLNLAFVFLLLGYGTKVGLAPLHAWLPDAHAEGPTPISAVLSGLLLNVALYAVLRFKLLLAANPGAIAPGPLMAAMGLVSLIFASFMLYRRSDIKRMFGYSSIEHMGIIVFAFGMGGPLANFAGLLHMTMHSLTKSAIFFAVGHISQVKGTQKIANIRGLTETHPALGWSLILGMIAIMGMPPMGIFMSEFLVVSSTFARIPLLAVLLVTALLVGIGALFWRLHGFAFGQPKGSYVPVEASYLPMAGHLGLVLLAGIYLPPPLVAWFQHVAHLLG
jgi:hydrogenase-4 component F